MTDDQTQTTRRAHLRRLAAACLVGGALAGCGGGGDDEPAPAPAPSPPPAPAPAANPLGLDLPAPGSLSGELTLVAGTIHPTELDLCGGLDGLRTTSRIGTVVAMTVAPDGVLYFIEKPAERAVCGTEIWRRRLRAVDLNGNVRTLIDWMLRPEGDALEINDVAVAADGSVYLAEGYPRDWAVFATPGYPLYPDGAAPCVWRLSPNGNVSVVAGRARAYRGLEPADGQGEAAVFVSLERMVLGRDGLLYVNDRGSVRTVSLDGWVTTTGTSASLLGSPTGRVFVRRSAQAGTELTDLHSGVIWPVASHLGVSGPAVDGFGGMHQTNVSLRATAVYRLTSDGGMELAVGRNEGVGSVTELGALPARLAAVNAIAGGLGREVFIAANGAILKARFDS